MSLLLGLSNVGMLRSSVRIRDEFITKERAASNSVTKTFRGMNRSEEMYVQYLSPQIIHMEEEMSYIPYLS